MKLGTITNDRLIFTLTCGCAGHTVLGIEDSVLQKKTDGRVGHTLGGIAIEITSRNPTCSTHNPTPQSRYFLAPAETVVLPG
jgi:hypothetical protein